MATLSTIRTNARITLLEPTASHWADAELLTYIQHGIKDLWRAIIELHQRHFVTIDESNVSMAASTTTLTGVPADVYRVHLIEPRVLTTVNSARGLRFLPRRFNSREFQAARALGDQTPGVGLTVFYEIINAGAPVAAPTIRVAPTLTSAVNLTMEYVPTLASADIEAADENPIPGESDLALEHWCVAFARATEREDRSPDPEHLAIYMTLKDQLKVSLAPRQDQEPEVVPALFEDYLPG